MRCGHKRCAGPASLPRWERSDGRILIIKINQRLPAGHKKSAHHMCPADPHPVSYWSVWSCTGLALHWTSPRSHCSPKPGMPPGSPRGQRISVGVTELMELAVFFRVRSCDFPDSDVFALFQSPLCRFVMWERVLPVVLEVRGHMSRDGTSLFARGEASHWFGFSAERWKLLSW